MPKIKTVGVVSKARVGEIVDSNYKKKIGNGNKYDWLSLKIEFLKRGDEVTARHFISERFNLSKNSGFLGLKVRGWDRERKMLREKALFDAKKHIIQSLMLTKEELLSAKDKTLRKIIRHLDRDNLDLKELTIIYENIREELGEGRGAVDMVLNFVIPQKDGDKPRDIAEADGSLASLV